MIWNFNTGNKNAKNYQYRDWAATKMNMHTWHIIIGYHNETKLMFIALELPQTSHAMAIAYNSGCIGVQLQMMSWHPVCLKEKCLTVTESVESFQVGHAIENSSCGMEMTYTSYSMFLL